jgi:hypothetical protein
LLPAIHSRLLQSRYQRGHNFVINAPNADDARKLLTNDVDPGVVEQQSKRGGKENAANSFEAIAHEWFAKFSPQWA